MQSTVDSVDWARLPCDFIAVGVRRITNAVNSVSRGVYHVSGKPPATIKWE